MTSKAILSLAAKIADRLYRDYLDYLDACESWRRDGYRPHYCEHGTNQWTDYDNICGPCEDGLSMSDGVFRREHALDQAKRRDAKCKELIKAFSTLRDAGITVDDTALWKEITRLLTP